MKISPRAQVAQWLAEVAYKDWTFRVRELGDGTYLQVCFRDESGRGWRGRKWYISPHARKSEVIQTALKAVLTAEEHEAREQFLYRGQAIFGPHLDVDELLDAKLEVRS